MVIAVTGIDPSRRSAIADNHGGAAVGCRTGGRLGKDSFVDDWRECATAHCTRFRNIVQDGGGSTSTRSDFRWWLAEARQTRYLSPPA